jgi:hypothetical protein
MTDATIVTKTVLNYFKASGMTPIAYEVLSTKKGADGKWKVTVQFFPWLGAQKVSKYCVSVAKDGQSIDNVERV